MVGELLKELQCITKEVLQAKEENNKIERLREKEEVDEIISQIPCLLRKAVRSGKRGFCVMWLDSETGSDVIVGHSVETLAGSAKIVFDWCKREGFDTRVFLEPGPHNDGCYYYLHISGW